MRHKKEAIKVRSSNSHRGCPEKSFKSDDKRCKYLTSRRVVLVSKDDSINMNLPFFNKPSPVLSDHHREEKRISSLIDQHREEKRISRRKRIESGHEMQTFTSRKKRVFQLFNRPNAPHNTNTVIMESQGTPGRVLDLEKYETFFDDDVNLCGSFLLRDSDYDESSDAEQTDMESQEE